MQSHRHMLLGTELIEKLLKQDHRSHDRDASEAWMAQENFGEFYAESKHFFIAAFSTPEKLAEKIIHVYVMRQLSTFLNRSPSEVSDIAGLMAEMDGAIAANNTALIAILRKCWPAEWADIKARNVKPVLF